MKERTALGLGVRKSPDIISISHEDQMFHDSLLGNETPIQLFKTVIDMIGLHCALRGGSEHNRLCRLGFDCQITIKHDDRGIERLIYKEDALHKTHQGGLSCKPFNKVVYVYPSANVSRCPVRILKKYVGLLPPPKSCKKALHAC